MAMDTLDNTQISQNERLWAASAHVGALLAALLTHLFAGVAGMGAAIAIWFLVRDRYPFAATHAKEAFNFNLSMFIYACIAIVIGVVLFGATVLTLGIGALVTLPAALVLVAAVVALAIAWLVLSVVAGVKAYEGQPYHYPLTFRVLK